ncbi:B9D2 protein, partial [Urocolius indicus]|nr:B9D2 protein [Urocolius indicus]
LAYGCCHVPFAPGTHELRVPTWKPLGGEVWERFRSFWLGGGPQLKDPTGIMMNSDGPPGQRWRLRSESSGTVLLQLGLLLRHFGRYGVQC